jgi:hypothetical protein
MTESNLNQQPDPVTPNDAGIDLRGPVDLGIQVIRRALAAKGMTMDDLRDRFDTTEEFEFAKQQIETLAPLTVAQLVDYCGKLDIVPGVVLVDKPDSPIPTVPANQPPATAITVFDKVVVVIDMTSQFTEQSVQVMRDHMVTIGEERIRPIAAKMGINLD